MLRSNPRMGPDCTFFASCVLMPTLSEGKTAADIAAENENLQIAQILQVISGGA